MERKPEQFLDSLRGDLHGVRIGVPKEYLDLAENLDPDVKKAMVDTIHLLSRNGAIVEFFQLGMVDYVIPAYYIIASAEASSNLAGLTASNTATAPRRPTAFTTCTKRPVRKASARR